MIRKILFVSLLFTFAISFAQRIKIDKKKLEFLKEEKEIGVKLTFPEDIVVAGFNLTLPVGYNYAKEIKGNMSSEKVFVEKMIKKWNKKDSINGDTWLSKYNEAKDEVWRQNFIRSIHQNIDDYSDFRFVVPNENTKYILIIEADWMYFGYGKVQIARNGAKMKNTLKFVKVTDTEEVIYETETPNILGDYVKGEFGDIARMGSCYNKLGYLLSLQFKRILK
ncbi:hypothetical protein [Aquimarina sp. RZ0]|uniref:hypothetical protein n=1 Tax=Aquimarina sp. RZ0 TaxID=2607730 RepID=UPI0011F22DDE|nr:hypothetical protein [Aquimarina sp. RZ0]KAA1246436.1 hypothetical protein F0000_07450 [Aquimarina sp. RZ0]